MKKTIIFSAAVVAMFLTSCTDNLLTDALKDNTNISTNKEDIGDTGSSDSLGTTTASDQNDSTYDASGDNNSTTDYTTDSSGTSNPSDIDVVGDSVVSEDAGTSDNGSTGDVVGDSSIGWIPTDIITDSSATSEVVADSL